MFARALFAFLALPGIVAFAAPIWYLVTRSRTQLLFPWSLVPLLIGCAGLLWCVREFYVSGKGTLAPWSPPRHLVITGLYRYSRNPMYLSVLLILLGWATGFGAWRGLRIYLGCVALAFYVRVVLFEEPWLARTHGEVWTEYARRVRRWL